MNKAIFLMIILLAINLVDSYAQEQEETAPIYRIETRDGNEFVGWIVDEEEERVRIKTQTLGEVTIARKDIRNMRLLEGAKVHDGAIWAENPQAARYFWAPNGYGLKRGEGYYQNLWVLFNQASVGITDHFSIGAGLVPLFLFAGTPSPIWLTPKLSVPVVKDKFNLGGGALLGTVAGEDDMGFGIVYGVSTFGNRDRNITFGLGYGYAGGEWADSPMINISGIARIGRNGYLLTENYYLDVGEGNLLLLSFGGRWMIKKVGLDFGLFIPLEEELNDFVGFVALPWLGFSVPFGSAR